MFRECVICVCGCGCFAELNTIVKRQRRQSYAMSIDQTIIASQGLRSAPLEMMSGS